MPEITTTNTNDAVRLEAVVNMRPGRRMRQKGLDDNDSWVDDGFFDDIDPNDAPRKMASDFSRSD